MMRVYLLFALTFDFCIHLAPAAGTSHLRPRTRGAEQTSARLHRVREPIEDLGLLEEDAVRTEAASQSTRRFQSFCEQDKFAVEWSDEFNGKQLDSDVWQVVNSAGRPNGPQTSVVAGLEVTACRTADCRSNNVRLEDGKLILLSERAGENSSQYYTGAVTTKGRMGWADSPAYRMCVSAKLPGKSGEAGKGIWPAHWMLPENGISDSCLDEGEMDIMEMVNSDGGSYSTYHWMSSYPRRKCADFNTFHKSAHALTRMPADWNTNFHEYGLERSHEHLAFAVNGKVVLNVSARDAGTQLSHTPFFLILNTAIGGGWPGEPTELTQLPVEHVIDYVRVARRQNSTGVPPRSSAVAPHGPILTQISSATATFQKKKRPPVSYDHRSRPFDPTS